MQTEKGVERKVFNKEEFKRRLYTFVLQLIEFIDTLPKGRVSRIIGDQFFVNQKEPQIKGQPGLLMS